MENMGTTMNRNELIERIETTGKALGVEHLTFDAFRQHSGVSRATIEKHFDSWAEACEVAGVRVGLTIKHFAPISHSEEECVLELRRVAASLGQNDLTSKEFSKYARFSSSAVIRRFGSWQRALERAGLELSEKSKKSVSLSADECISEMKRVAALLGSNHLTTDSFDKYAVFTSHRVVRALGSWQSALEQAGLELSPNFKQEIPFPELAQHFLAVTVQLSRVPSLVQLARRSTHASATFSRNRGGYKAFKRKAIAYLLASDSDITPEIEKVIREEQLSIDGAASNPVPNQVSDPPILVSHYQGRTLNFRAFTYAPTCEHDVVQMFGSVAQELGFEIIGNRSAFPDCEARRKLQTQRERYEKCLIEYEFSSGDYKKHRHTDVGCDLIVCWQHNWLECPIEVLELESAIRKLQGWR